MPRFQYNAKSIFLTYSQCPIEPTDILEWLKTRTGSTPTTELKKACIGQELHQDGNKHLHLCAWYTQPLRFDKPDYFDYFGYHPNVSGDRIKSVKAALKYVSKECPLDRLVQYNMDIKEETAAREGHRKILGKRLITEPLVEVLEDGNFDLIFDYTKLKTNIMQYHMDKEEAGKLKKP